MKKALLPLVIASVLPTAAFADVTVYGKANVSWQFTEKSVGDLSYTEVVNNASRIGLKGSEAVNDDLKVIYQFEYETKVDDGINSNNQTFSQRNIFVGLQGVAGTATVGMFDTPLKMAQEKIDLFNDMVGDIKVVLKGETRAKNVVQYSTPAFFNITGNVAYINTEQDTANSTDGYSASIVYNTKIFYFAVANDHNVELANTVAPTTSNDTDILRAVGRVVLGPVVLGALYETYDNGVIDEDGSFVSAQYNITDKWAVKAQYGASEMTVMDGTTLSFGVDYKMTKAAKLFAYATTNEAGAILPAAEKKDDYLGVGIELNF